MHWWPREPQCEPGASFLRDLPSRGLRPHRSDRRWLMLETAVQTVHGLWFLGDLRPRPLVSVTLLKGQTHLSDHHAVAPIGMTPPFPRATKRTRTPGFTGSTAKLGPYWCCRQFRIDQKVHPNTTWFEKWKINNLSARKCRCVFVFEWDLAKLGFLFDIVTFVHISCFRGTCLTVQQISIWTTGKRIGDYQWILKTLRQITDYNLAALDVTECDKRSITCEGVGSAGTMLRGFFGVIHKICFVKEVVGSDGLEKVLSLESATSREKGIVEQKRNGWTQPREVHDGWALFAGIRGPFQEQKRGVSRPSIVGLDEKVLKNQVLEPGSATSSRQIMNRAIKCPIHFSCT